MVQTPVYLDHHATTPTDPRVLGAMLPYFTTKFGNAASISHSFGTEAREAVETARAQVAELINADPRCIVFTSGATEASNLAIKGLIGTHRSRTASSEKPHIVTDVAEHRAVLDPVKRLQRSGCDATFVAVDSTGQVDPQAIADELQARTVLVSVMLANNEVGTINAVDEIGVICRQAGVTLHCDAVQAAGRIPIDVDQLDVDLLSLSAHKMYGPKGIGALFVRRKPRRVRLEPLFDGGGHENGMRSGTLPVPLIVGFGEACRISRESLDSEPARIAELRDRLREGILSQLDGVQVNGHSTEALSGTLNLSFEGLDGDVLMNSMTEIAVSSGSACTSANPEPSHVLKAMGLSDALTRASLRFGIGRFNTPDEIDFAIEFVVSTVRRLRNQSSS